jgi:phosphoribosylanthranilate isomerase
MLVKICGITRIQDALACAQSGVDMVGFVFAASPRRLDAAKAQRIGSLLPTGIARVGVFRDQPLEDVLRTCAAAALDYVQLHGNESPAFCERVREETGARIIKALAVRSREDIAGARAYDDDSVSLILLDSPKNEMPLQQGARRLWEILDTAPTLAKPWLMAGGLSDRNVGEVVRLLAPAGVDVSSGVESSPGIKDISKVRRFISEAKSHTSR